MPIRRSRLVVAPLVLIGGALAAQVPAPTPVDTTHRYQLPEIVVTATRSPLTLDRVPQAVNLIDATMLHAAPNASPIRLFGDLPGLDLTGVGPSQARPVIRGEVGQRILLLEDGLRLNNSRRQSDFGELPSLVDPNTLDRVEVVRGPSSVLYGSDAIGGVVNLIGASLPWGATSGAVHGALRYSLGSNGGESRPSLTTDGRFGKFLFRLDGTLRTADPYDAPSGSFGDVTLTGSQRVRDSGVRDRNFTGALGYAFTPDHRLFFKESAYAADTAGFGWVDPAAIGSGTTVQILYPRQRVARETVGYSGRNIRSPFLDRLEVTGYAQSNDRKLDQNITVPFGPGAQGDFHTRNVTDVATLGGRIEAAKVIGTTHLVTYGVDVFRDRTTNTDHDTTTITGFGPPSTTIDSAPNLPNASFRALGLFAQDAIQLTGRLNVVLGARYQDNHAETRVTPNLPDAPVSSTDRAVAGAVNALYAVSDEVSFLATVGRGFRSPDLVERFFNGVTPEGSGFQSRNLDLKPETSLNTDLGIRLRHGVIGGELIGFRSTLYDGIRIVATGDSVNGFPEYQNVNIDRIHTWGIEGSAHALVVQLFTLSASYSWLHQENSDTPLTPVGQSYDTKVTAALRYDHPAGHLWSAVRLRHQGATDQVALGTSPVGTKYPGFTTLAFDAGLKLLDTGHLQHSAVVSVENLTDQLYAEAGNAGFFRPEPGRRVEVGWTTSF